MQVTQAADATTAAGAAAAVGSFRDSNSDRIGFRCCRCLQLHLVPLRLRLDAAAGGARAESGARGAATVAVTETHSDRAAAKNGSNDARLKNLSSRKTRAFALEAAPAI